MSLKVWKKHHKNQNSFSINIFTVDQKYHGSQLEYWVAIRAVMIPKISRSRITNLTEVIPRWDVTDSSCGSDSSCGIISNHRYIYLTMKEVVNSEAVYL